MEDYTPSGGYASLRRALSATDATTIRSLAWAGVLMGVTTGVLMWLRADGYRLPALWQIAALGLIAAVAERKGVHITDRMTVSVSFLPLVFAAVALGPLGGLVVGAISNSSDLRSSRLRWAVYTPIRALTAASAGLAAWTFFPHPSKWADYLLASLVASAADLVAEFTLTGITALVRGAVAQMRQLLSVHQLTFPVYVPVLALLVYTSKDSFVAAVILLGFALSAQKFLLLYLNEKETAARLAGANSRLRAANVRFMTNLVDIMEGQDPYTRKHSLVVATYARDIAERMGLSDDDCGLVHLCGLVHDIGKYRIDTNVLRKPGPLTLDERRLIEMHPEWGEEMIRQVGMEEYGDIGTVVRHHHEWINGKGYPDCLTDTEIPTLSKIISVADAYNAMTSKRPYRDAMPSRVARLRLAQAVGTQFDISVVAAFEAILAMSDEDYRIGVGPRFVLGWNEAADGEATQASPLQAAS